MSKRKARRAVRVFPKRYSSTIIGGTSNMDKQYFREAIQRAKYRDDDYLLGLFGLRTVPDDVTKVSQNQRRKTLGLHPSIKHSSREIVMDRLSLLVQNVPADNHIRLVNRKSCVIYMYWTDDHERYFFVKQVFTVFATSISYPSRDRAMQSFRTDKIIWVKRIHMPEHDGECPPTPQLT